MCQDGNKGPIRRRLWSLFQSQFSTLARMKFQARKPPGNTPPALRQVHKPQTNASNLNIDASRQKR